MPALAHIWTRAAAAVALSAAATLSAPAYAQSHTAPMTPAMANDILATQDNIFSEVISDLEELPPLPGLYPGECYTIFNGSGVHTFYHTPYEVMTPLYVPGIRMTDGNVLDPFGETVTISEHFNDGAAVVSRHGIKVIPDTVTVGCFTHQADAVDYNRALNNWYTARAREDTIGKLSALIRQNAPAP